MIGISPIGQSATQPHTAAESYMHCSYYLLNIWRENSHRVADQIMNNQIEQFLANCMKGKKYIHCKCWLKIAIYPDVNYTAETINS